MHLFLKFIIGMNLYMFRTVPLSIIRSFSLYTQQCHTGYVDCLLGSQHNLFDIYHCRVYSEKLLIIDRGTVWNV
jgi:hypothetical protein